MTPNHHWSVHTPDQILDFGPVYDFWTFMTERLNKILKSINNNHWGGGRLEVSMMRGFGRETQFETLVTIHPKLDLISTNNSQLYQAQTVRESPDNNILKKISRMLDKTEEDRGTVQASGNDVNNDFVDDGMVHSCYTWLFAHAFAELSHVHIELGPAVPGLQIISPVTEAALVKHYNSGNIGRVHHMLTRQPPHGSRLFTATSVKYFEYALLDGRHITPSARTHRKTARSSIVKLVWKDMFAGIVENIFRHTQKDVLDDTIWAEIRWMKHLDVSPVKDDPWSIV